MKSSHFKHLFGGKFALWMILAAVQVSFLFPKSSESFDLRLHPSFVNGVDRILFWSSDSQMFGVATSWIVSTGTVVKDKHSIWNWSMMQFPREAMCINLNFVYAEQSITGRRLCAYPQPATVRLFINEAPEALFRGAPTFLNRFEQSAPLGIWQFNEESSLDGAMPDVLELSPQEKMIWIATRRAVALVADNKSGRNWSISEDPRKSVSRDLFAIDGRPAISALLERSGKQPAAGRVFDDARPESCLVFDCGDHRITIS